MHVDAAATLLRATRISAGLRRRRLTVLSVHGAVVNLVDADGELVPLAADAVGGLPDGILVADAPDFTQRGIRPGMPARWTAEALLVPGAALLVRTSDAAAWSPQIAAHDAGAWPFRSTRAWAYTEHIRTRGGLADIAIATPVLATLDDAIRSGDRLAAAAASRRLIGLGPGLTPSGDDALAGIESALYATAHPMAGFLAAALDDVDARTTTVSSAMLRHAARGDAAERIQRLLDGLLARDPHTLAPAIDAAVRWGATSGSDLLAGVLLGLDAATGVAAPRRLDRMAA